MHIECVTVAFWLALQSSAQTIQDRFLGGLNNYLLYSLDISVQN